MQSYQRPSSFQDGRYIPKVVLGTGTYGQVIRCYDRVTGVDVAVKVAQRDDAYRRSALNEIRAMHSLRHCSDVIKAVDSFEDNGHVCIVSELLDRNLLEVLRSRKGGPLALSEVRDASLHIFRGLAALHNAGYMHCDIKPENIMLRRPAVRGHDHPSPNYATPALDSLRSLEAQESGAYSLCHFNSTSNSSSDENEDAINTPYTLSPSVMPIAREDYSRACLIDLGAVRRFHENMYYDVQSLWYRAPEVLCGVPYSPAIDAWSMGCLLFELYTGKPLFRGENATDQLSRIVQVVGCSPHAALSLNQRTGQVRLPIAPQPRENVEVTLRAWVNAARLNSVQHAQSQLSAASVIGRVTPVSSDSDQSFRFPQFGCAEDAFIDLLVQLLHPDESQRLGCREALLHPFFSHATAASVPSAPAPRSMLRDAGDGVLKETSAANGMSVSAANSLGLSSELHTPLTTYSLVSTVNSASLPPTTPSAIFAFNNSFTLQSPLTTAPITPQQLGGYCNAMLPPAVGYTATTAAHQAPNVSFYSPCRPTYQGSAVESPCGPLPPSNPRFCPAPMAPLPQPLWPSAELPLEHSTAMLTTVPLATAAQPHVTRAAYPGGAVSSLSAARHATTMQHTSQLPPLQQPYQSAPSWQLGGGESSARLLQRGSTVFYPLAVAAPQNQAAVVAP